MPWPERNRKGSQKAIRSMTWGFVTPAKDTRLAVVADEGPAFRPSVFAPDQSKSPVLAEVTGKNVIVLILKDTYS